MLNSIRKFTNSFWAKILLVIIIIPFVFWGMGSVFQGGGKNTVAKIGNYNVSTKEFVEYVNSLNIDPEVINKNIDNNIIEELASSLINKIILEMETKELSLVLSDNSLSEILKKDENFHDEKKQFSRIKYEKFLIANNVIASSYEKKIREEQTNKLLFKYISGGTYSPSFLVKDTYNYQNKILNIKALNLDPLYKKEEDFDKSNIDKYINENKEKLKEEFVSFRFATINPLSLVETEEFNELFFEKIDEIESLIINDTNYENIIKKYNLKTENIKLINKYRMNKNGILEKNINQKLLDKVFEIKKNKNINLLENENEYVLLIIDEIINEIPDINSQMFRKKIVNKLIKNYIFEHNNRLMAKIKTKTLSNSEFNKLAEKSNTEIINLTIKGIGDNNFFSPNSNNQIFRLKQNGFTIVDEIQKNKTFLVQVTKLQNPTFSKSLSDYDKYYNETLINLKNNIYSSYDLYIGQKYEVEINYQTLDRLKNYFR